MTRHRFESMADWLARTDAQYERRLASKHYVYRAFDEFDLLLYIGCTLNVEQRMATHRSTSPWARFGARIEVEGPFPGMPEARAAEKKAIDSEGAFFNATQADIQRTQANRHAAVRSLREIGIFEPQWDGSDEEILDGNEKWENHCDEHAAYVSLKREIGLALKGGAFPYLTQVDRIENYLSARALAERGAA